MRITGTFGALAVGFLAFAAAPTWAAPTLVAESSAFFLSDSDSDSSGPVTGPNPGFYFAESYAEDEEGQAFADSYGDVLDGVALFETYADVSLFDTEFYEEEGSAGALAKFTVFDTLTNTGSSSDTAFLSFHIGGWDLELLPSESATSVSVSATILVEGSPIWSLTAGIDSVGGTPTPFLTGFGPGGLPSQFCFPDGAECIGSSYTGLLDLGLLAPGESVGYTYVLESSVFIEDVLEENFGYAFITDPTEGFFGGVGPLPGSGGGTGVSTPGPLALLGFGLVGFAVQRRRSRQH